MSIDKKIISVEEFDTMKSVFNEKIKSKIGEAYSDYVTISIEDLKEYILMLEKQARDAGAEEKDILFHFISQNTDTGQLTLALEGTFDNEELKAPLLNKTLPCPPFCGKR